MLLILVLIVCLALLVVVLGLPALLGSDSPGPDVIGFAILAVMVAAIVWLMGAWWVLAPIAALSAWVRWLDKTVGDAPADFAALDEGGTSAGTRTRGRRCAVAIIVAGALFAAIFVLPALAGAAVLDVLIPCLVIALTAVGLFRFSYYRSVRRDDFS